MYIVTVAEMQSIEKKAHAAGISYETMMAHAGSGVMRWVDHNLNCSKGVVGLVGSGNNGGDTLIALTELSKRGIRTQAFLARPREADPLIETYMHSGGVVIDLSENTRTRFARSGSYSRNDFAGRYPWDGFQIAAQG